MKFFSSPRSCLRPLQVVWLILLALPILVLAQDSARAQTTPSSSGSEWSQPPKIGARGVAIADPTIARPPGPSCTVTLYSNVAFGPHGVATAMNANPIRWHYAPPADCPGPWAKVVLEADFSVTAGRQFDRTANIWLKGVNLYFGTTAEPSSNRAPHWQIERDLTSYASLFAQPGEGQVDLNNWVTKVYNGVIRGSARVVFYPEPKGKTPAQTANLVYGLDGDTDGAAVNVQNQQQALTRTFHLPRNIERAYLDIIAQSQATDEQWYMCIDDKDVLPTLDFSLGPPASNDPLEQCGNGNFREVAVSIDGQPAGRAPIYPWTYTGGVDPYLWRPIPDVQTLNFVPYTLDLTPFAGLLDNGKPHTIRVRVLYAHHFFSLAANLRLYLDPASKVLTGRILENTLATNAAQLAPRVTRNWKSETAERMDGEVNTTAQGNYTIRGELNTAQGKILTEVSQQSRFTNQQTFLHLDPSNYNQIIRQMTFTQNQIRTTKNGTTTVTYYGTQYPLLVLVDKTVLPDGAFKAALHMEQSYMKFVNKKQGSKTLFWSRLGDGINNRDTASFNAQGTAITQSQNQQGYQRYFFMDSLGSCYASVIASKDGAVIKAPEADHCGGGNHIHWESDPNAM